jgi:hypothetical protein
MSLFAPREGSSPGRVEAEVMRRDALLQEQISNNGDGRSRQAAAPAVTPEEVAVPGAPPPAGGMEAEWKEFKARGEALKAAQAKAEAEAAARKRAQREAEERDAAAEAPKDAAAPVVLSKGAPNKSAALFIQTMCRTPEGITLRYVVDENGGGAFHCWDGRVWRKESRELIGKRVAEFFEAAKMRSDEGEVRFQYKRDEVGQVLHFLAQRLVVPIDMVVPAWLRPDGSWEAAGDWLVCTNCLVNARTGETRAHTPELFTRGGLEWAWDPDAVCPEWLKFREEVHPGDAEAQDAIEEWLSYNMTSDVSIQKGMAWGGESRSGKGTITQVLRALVGAERYASPALGGFGRAEFAKQGLLGKQAIVFADERMKKAQRYGPSFDPGGVQHDERTLLLKITGGDAVEVKLKFVGEPVNVVLPGKVTIVANVLLNFNDPTLAERFIVVFFGRNFEKEGLKDPRLFEEKLRPELSGIAARCLAYRRMKARGEFVQPASGEAWRAGLAALATPTFEAAVRLLFVPDAAGWAVKTEARKVFDAWCDQYNPVLKSQVAGNVFAQWLKAQPGFEAIVYGVDHKRLVDGRWQHVYLGSR